MNTHYGEFVSTVKSTGDLNAKVSDVARTVKQLADSVDTTYVRPRPLCACPPAPVALKAAGAFGWSCRRR